MKRTLITILALLLLVSCLDDDPGPGINALTAFIIPGDFKEGGPINTIITDLQGNVLAEKTIPREKLTQVEGVSSDELINITVIFPPQLNKDGITEQEIVTYQNFPKGVGIDYSTFDRPPDIGEATFTFTNVPDYDKIIVSTFLEDLEAARNNEVTSGVNYSLPLISEDQPLHIQWKPVNEGSNRTVLFQPLQVGGVDTIDLSQSASVNSKNIIIPSAINYDSGYFQLQGLNRANIFRSLLLDKDSDIPVTDTVNMSFPVALFSEYISEIGLSIPDLPHDFYTQTIYGLLPDNFELLDSGFELINSNISTFNMTTTGFLNFYQVTWSTDNQNDEVLKWTILGPGQLEVNAMIPEISNCSCTILRSVNDLNLKSIQLDAFGTTTGFISYNNYINFVTFGVTLPNDLLLHRSVVEIFN